MSQVKHQSAIADELRGRLKLKYMGDCKCGHCALVPDDLVARAAQEIERLRANGREAVAAWMIHHGYATGHGDTIEDLLTELAGQRP